MPLEELKKNLKGIGGTIKGVAVERSRKTPGVNIVGRFRKQPNQETVKAIVQKFVDNVSTDASEHGFLLEPVTGGRWFQLELRISKTKLLRTKISDFINKNEVVPLKYNPPAFSSKK